VHVTGDLIESIQEQVRHARVMRGESEVAAGRSLLRQAEATASGVPSESVREARAFQAVLDLRNELGCCLLAAERLEEAGVERRVVVGILERGAASAEGILGRLAGTLEQPGTLERC
jgi:hypothetical protein